MDTDLEFQRSIEASRERYLSRAANDRVVGEGLNRQEKEDLDRATRQAL